MLARFRPSLTYANVMASVAVFLALGGGAYAAFSLPKNSVGSKQLKKHAVTPSKVANRTVTLFKGQRGDRGPRGPSDIYADGTAFATLTTSNTAYGHTTVPAGSYLLEGKAIFNAGAGGGRMGCKLTPEPSKFDTVYWDEAFATGDNTASVLSLSAVQTFASAQSVDLVCKLDSGTGNIDDARVIAIKTEALHGSTPRD